MNKLYLALLHYPVLNKLGDTVTTSITNLDIHDIARASISFGVSRYHIVHPDPGQQMLVSTILNFWKNEELAYNPHRSMALENVRINSTLEEVLEEITTQEGKRPITVTTTARHMRNQVSFRYLRSQKHRRPILLLFGTGHGLCDEVHRTADHILEPLKGTGDYNHLSVRSAVSIVLDRITSEYIYGRNHGYSAHSWQRPNQNRLS